MQKNTSDARETFNYWSRMEAPPNLQLLNGQYWQSPHFTKEYIMYLKFKPTNDWWDEYIKYNAIAVDNESWSTPTDAPTWFKPSASSVRYGRGGSGDQGSRCFRDSITGISYIYEIQL